MKKTKYAEKLIKQHNDININKTIKISLTTPIKDPYLEEIRKAFINAKKS